MLVWTEREASKWVWDLMIHESWFSHFVSVRLCDGNVHVHLSFVFISLNKIKNGDFSLIWFKIELLFVRHVWNLLHWTFRLKVTFLPFPGRSVSPTWDSTGESACWRSGSCQKTPSSRPAVWRHTQQILDVWTWREPEDTVRKPATHLVVVLTSHFQHCWLWTSFTSCSSARSETLMSRRRKCFYSQIWWESFCSSFTAEQADSMTLSSLLLGCCLPTTVRWRRRRTAFLRCRCLLVAGGWTCPEEHWREVALETDRAEELWRRTSTSSAESSVHQHHPVKPTELEKALILNFIITFWLLGAPLCVYSHLADLCHPRDSQLVYEAELFPNFTKEEVEFSVWRVQRRADECWLWNTGSEDRAGNEGAVPPCGLSEGKRDLRDE